MGQTASPPPPRSCPSSESASSPASSGAPVTICCSVGRRRERAKDRRTACEPSARLSAHALTHAQSHTHAPINPSLSRDNCSRRRRLLRSRLSSFPRRPSSSRRKSCVALSPPQPPPPLHLSHCICHTATRKNPAKADQVLIIQVPCPLSKPVLCNISVKLNFPLGISTRQPRTFI